MKRAKQAKKTLRKTVPRKRQTKAQKAAQAEAVLRASLRKIDPYYLDAKLIPVEWSYQWSHEGAINRGWSPVPFSRHAHDFPRSYQSAQCIVHKGLILVEAPATHVADQHALNRKAALDMGNEALEAIARSSGAGFHIMSSEWVETESIPRDAAQNEGPPVEVAVTLVMKVPVRWNSAALYLKLTLNEYVRRRILMERPVLGCMDPFAQESVYEPVVLSFSPKET